VFFIQISLSCNYLFLFYFDKKYLFIIKILVFHIKTIMICTKSYSKPRNKNNISIEREIYTNKVILLYIVLKSKPRCTCDKVSYHELKGLIIINLFFFKMKKNHCFDKLFLFVLKKVKDQFRDPSEF